MSLTCGVDIVEIERIKASLVEQGSTFRDRIFTENEIEYCEARNAARYESYAVRFAGKEAVSKALGTGMGRGVEWRNIEILNNSDKKPYVVLTGKAREIFHEAGGIDISISLSHCRSSAVAYAVIEFRKDGA